MDGRERGERGKEEEPRKRKFEKGDGGPAEICLYGGRARGEIGLSRLLEWRVGTALGLCGRGKNGEFGAGFCRKRGRRLLPGGL